MKVIFIFILAFSSLAGAEVTTCASNQYLVRSHFRKAYIRSDGTHVSASQVKSYCKDLTKELVFLKDRFKDGIPKGWPHKTEKSKKWT